MIPQPIGALPTHIALGIQNLNVSGHGFKMTSDSHGFPVSPTQNACSATRNSPNAFPSAEEEVPKAAPMSRLQQTPHEQASPPSRNANNVESSGDTRFTFDKSHRTMSLTIVEPTRPDRFPAMGDSGQFPPGFPRTDSISTGSNAPTVRSAASRRSACPSDSPATDVDLSRDSDDEIDDTGPEDADAVAAKGEAAWTPMLEERLIFLQAQLKGSQRRWSASQELWLKEIEPLLELRREHQKQLKSKKQHPRPDTPGSFDDAQKQAAISRSKRAIGNWRRLKIRPTLNRVGSSPASLPTFSAAPRNEPFPSFPSTTTTSEKQTADPPAGKEEVNTAQFPSAQDVSEGVARSPSSSPPATQAPFLHPTTSTAAPVLSKARPSPPKLSRTTSTPLTQRLRDLRRRSLASPSSSSPSSPSPSPSSAAASGPGARRISTSVMAPGGSLDDIVPGEGTGGTDRDAESGPAKGKILWKRGSLWGA